MTQKGQTRDPNTLRPQYLENGWRETRSVPKDYQQEMSFWELNGHLTYDVT